MARMLLALTTALLLAGCPPGFEAASGVVFDEDGKPVAGAWTTLIPLDDFDSYTAAKQELEEVGYETGQDGRWPTRCLPPGRFEVQVNELGFNAAVVRGVTGALTRVVLRRGGAVVSGKVVAATGNSPSDVRLSITSLAPALSVDPWFPALRRLELKPDFSFETPALTDGRWELSAYDKAGRRARHQLDVLNGKAPAVELVFSLATMSGVLLSSDGVPVPDAGVHASAESMLAEITRSGCGTVLGRRGFWAQTDGEGLFALPQLQADEVFLVDATGPEGRSSPLRNVPAHAQSLELRTVPGLGTDGVLIVPVAKAAHPVVELRRDGELQETADLHKLTARFETRPGTVEVDVFAPGMAARALTVEIAAAKTVSTSPVQLERERPLSIRVRDDATGKPLIGVRLLLENPLWQRAQLALTESLRNMLGHPPPPSTVPSIVLHGLSAGEVAFSVYVQGYALERFVAAAGQTEMEVRLRPHAPVRVSLISRDGGVLNTRLAFGVDPGKHLLAQDGGATFPAWFDSSADGGQVNVSEAGGGAVLRVAAYNPRERTRYVFLAAGDVAEPAGPRTLWHFNEWALRPRHQGISGVEFEPVLPGIYTVFVYEPESRLGATLRAQLWRRVVRLGEGTVALDLQSFEHRPDYIYKSPLPEVRSPNPLE